MNSSCTIITKRFVRSGRWKSWPNDWLPFTWKRPEQQPGYFDTGDTVEGIPAPKKEDFVNHATQLAVQECKSMNLSEEILRLFTNEFAKRQQKVHCKIEQNVYGLSGGLDSTTLAGGIVRMTYRIRNSRDNIRKHPNDVLSKIMTNWWSGKRLKRLVQLYKMDRQEFDRIVKELQLDLPQFGYDHKLFERIERKRELRRLTDEYCAKIKKERLEAYEKELKAEQQAFLRRKAETEQWIESEMQKLKLDKSSL